MKHIDIRSFGFSDHRGVIMNIDFKTFPLGPSCYKLNTEILNDLEFINMVKCEISKMSSLSNTLSPSLLWECIKAQIRSLGIIYSKNKSKYKKFKKYDLESKLNDLECLFSSNPGDETLQKQIIQTKSELEIFSIAESRGAQLRAGIKFSELGEKCNKFFLSLEKSRSTSNTIFRVNDGNNDLMHYDEILTFIAKYYENIYKSPPQKPPFSESNEARDHFLNPNNVKKLDDNEVEMSDIFISEG